MDIIDKNTLRQKTDTSIQENHIIRLYKDPTDSYQKQIQKAIQHQQIPIRNKFKKQLNNVT